MVDRTVLVAPAKLTVELRLTGVRDDGYHLIDAEMVTLELHDVLTVGAGDELTASGPFSAGMALDDSNLVRKALRLAGRTAAVHVDKQIPHGGGLGGGSADAAAVLRWGGFDDLVAASRLGADVPFCLRRWPGPRARASARSLEPLPHVARTVHPGHPAVRGLDAGRLPPVGRARRPVGDHRNDLEPAALDVEPRLVTWRDRITGDRACARCSPAAAPRGSSMGTTPTLAEALAGATVVVTQTVPSAGRRVGR